MFIYMVEEMGFKTKLITLKDIILFQLLLVFALPLVIRIFKRKDIMFPVAIRLKNEIGQ
ncbi:MULTISPECIES: hypothetical protein [Sphingobacterium]|uniref:hypothetical protein n=1 Tax=Sphingobacterium TaxID=28453 RepID=UPI0013DD7EC4|nr:MULTISPECIES: hypothetical protein [unclassified Sphingobacterium]